MGQAPSASSADEFPRPRTPLKFGSVPTPLPVDPKDYNISRRCNSVPEGSVSSFDAVLSQQSCSGNGENDLASSFNPSILSQESFFDGHEDMSPRPRSRASPSPASLNHRYFCLRDGCEFATAGFETAEELQLHKRTVNHHDYPETLSGDMVGAMPYCFFPGLCADDEPLSPKSTHPPLNTFPRHMRPLLPARPPSQLSIMKRRKLTPPPRRSHSSPQRIQPKVERPRPIAIMPQQPHHVATQCECQQCQQSLVTPRASCFDSPVHQFTPRAAPISPLAPTPQTLDFQTAWAMSPMYGAAMGGMQAVPSEYELQQFAHMQQQQFSQAPPTPAFQVVPQRGQFYPSGAAAYGVY